MGSLLRIEWAGFAIQILVLWLAFYLILRFFRGTRGAQILAGLILLLVVLIALTHLFRLDELNWLLRGLSVFLPIAVLIIFQPEIRRALAELGRRPVFASEGRQRSTVDSVVDAVMRLAQRRVGALVAIQREISTVPVQRTGVRVDAAVVPELLASIFFPHTPLHDGGVVISGDRIVAAGCLFPLSQKEGLSKALGTRHRAALGMSEESDAVVLVVSEETGTISVAYRGRLHRDLDSQQLERFLTAVLVREQTERSAWQRMREHLDLTPQGIAKSESLKGGEAP